LGLLDLVANPLIVQAGRGAARGGPGQRGAGARAARGRARAARSAGRA